jgi:hypothetical protein
MLAPPRMGHPKERQIYGSPAVLKQCVADKKFAYVVALARAANALLSAHSLMLGTEGRTGSGAQRDRMNAHFFASGILYECMKLIRAMNKAFAGDKGFETTMRLLLKDPASQALEQMHLKAARHGGIFHFLPDQFAAAIAKTGMTDCIFASTAGEKIGDVHYAFADYVTAEMMVGGRLDDPTIVNSMMENMLNLVKRFIEYSETFIADQLLSWGFEVRRV